MEKRRVQPTASATARHALSTVAAHASGWVACAAGRVVHRFAPGLRPAGTALLPAATKSLDVAADGRMLVLDATDRLRLGTPGEMADVASRPEISCAHFAGERNIWVAGDADGITFVELLGESGAVLSRLELGDIFADASLSFCRATHDEVQLWVGAGQDGQDLLGIRASGAGIAARYLSRTNYKTPGVLSTDGARFALIENQSDVVVRDFQTTERLAVWSWPGSDVTDGVKTDVAWIGDRVLFDTNEGRLYLLDPTLQVVDELILAGHEPRPCREVFPTLRDEGGFCTDLAFFVPAEPGAIVTVHGSDGGFTLAHWQLGRVTRR